MQKIIISSSSFILSEHPLWEVLKSKFTLDFSFVGNFSKSLLKKNEKNALNVCILFANDFLDENLSIYLNDNEVKKICNPIVELISVRNNFSQNPLIIGLAYDPIKNLLNSVYQITAIQKIFNYLQRQINKVQKKNRNIYFINLDLSFSYYGYAKIFDRRNFYLANSRISVEGLEILIRDLGLVLNRIYKPSKKLLILDCDNTLWGGIVGEEGIEHIKLGQDGIGKAFLNFQKTIKLLSNQGILLAISSKNNEKDVLNIFEKHESMQIKKNDIINFKINWDEKYKNILKISKELDLGLDSFVFWDDNPFERDKIKKNLPEVLTVEPNDDVVHWPDQLKELTELSKFSVTKEDEIKVKQYKIRSKFVTEKRKFSDEIYYLKSIKLKATRINIDESNITRAVQMTQKTNQFNLRTIRYTNDEINKIANQKKNISFLVKLKDIYGDHGIISLLLAKKLDNKSIFIDTLLISCRVLGRNLGTWVLRELKNMASKLGYENIYAEYIETNKNIICKSFYQNHNFEEIKKNKYDFEKKYKLNIKGKIYKLNLKYLNIEAASVYD